MESAEKVNSHEKVRRVRRNSPLVQAAFPDPGEIELVRQAAKANGASVSRFVRMAAVEVAKRVIDRHERGEF